MIIYKRLLGFLVSFLLSAFLLGAYYYSSKILYFIFFSFLILVFYFWSIKNRFVTYTLLIKYFLIILTFLLSVWSFFIVIDFLLVKYLVALLMFGCLIFILESFFKKVYMNKDISQALLIYIDLPCFWLVIYFLFYSLVLLRIGVLISSLTLLILIFSLTAIRFYWQKIDFKRNILYIFIFSIILIEIYIITSFLALNFYSSAFILWLWYSVLMDFFVDKIKDEFIWNKKRKLIFFIILLFIFYLISIR
jgi:hypothetical protein